jgi:hypothetical protein
MYVMKKFYLSIMALVGLATTSNAQCPVGFHATAFTIGGTPQYCKLFVGNGPVIDAGTDARLFVVDINGNPIPDLNGNTYSILDANRAITFEYNCQGIEHIEVDYWQGGVKKTCFFNPPPPAPLPIKLSGFNGRLNTETEATLVWTSSLEENSFQYEVQRSADGKNFVTVGKIKAAGTSLEAVKYSFNDPLPANGTYWYRLNMIDLDGKTELSKVVYVNSKKGSGIVTKLFPNPFTSEVQLIGATSADLNTPGNIKVYSMAGQLINFRIVGANAIAIDASAPKGMYFLKFNNGSSNQTFKLVKQ